MDRRELLAAVSSGAIVWAAGCIDGGSSADEAVHPLEIVVQNNHDRAYDVRTVMSDNDDTVVHEDSFTLGVGEGRGFSDEFPAGAYTIVVELSDRSELRSSWNTEFCDAHRVDTQIAVDGRVSQHVTCRAGSQDDGSDT